MAKNGSKSTAKYKLMGMTKNGSNLTAMFKPMKVAKNRSKHSLFVQTSGNGGERIKTLTVCTNQWLWRRTDQNPQIYMQTNENGEEPIKTHSYVQTNENGEEQIKTFGLINAQNYEMAKNRSKY